MTARRQARALLLAATALGTLGAAALTSAGSATAQPADPGLYCRPSPSFPYSGGYTVDPGGRSYSGTYYASGFLTCNGPVPSITITAIFHHKANSAGGGSADLGATQGNTITCTGVASCDATASYTRNAYSCGVAFTYEDYTQITGTWVNPSNGAAEPFSGDSGTSTGSSYNPPGC